MRAFGLLGLAMLGCNAPVALNPVEEGPPSTEDPGGVEDIPGSDTGTPDLGGPDPVSDALYDVSTVHEIRIELAADSRASLAAMPREYARGAVEIGGERYEDVGIRLKGNNSFRPLGEKPSFKIKLDEFVEDQSHGRMEGLTLNNMIEDPTFARELLTYWLWNDAGMIAPRAAYAHVTVDGEDYGLY
ncbi:MAG: CotH kinase family protein, partial [Myxococcota bacterium]